MVRLSKDAQPRASDAAAVGLLRLKISLEALAESALRLAAQIRAMRAARYTYACPMAASAPGGFGPACGRTWDRGTVPAAELRADVWDHLQAAHRMPAPLADAVVQKIRERS